MAGIATQYAEEQLAKIDAEIKSKTGDLVTLRDELQAELKRLKRGSGSTGGTTESVPNEKIVEAISALTSAQGSPDSVSSPEIAAHLGVDVRKIARKLAKMGSDGDSITGNKDDGYSVA